MLRLAIFLLLWGCGASQHPDADDKVYPGCGVSMGTCHEQSTACGIRVSCPGRTLALKCTAPPEGSKTIDCQCNENAVLGKQVTVAFGTHANPFSGDLKAIVKSACGYE